MSQTISSEAKQLSKLPTDIDRFRRKYIVHEGDFMIYMFSPFITGFENNYYYLLKHSTETNLERRYFKRPAYLSKDQYGTISLWQLLLFINDITCIENFITETVYIPNYSAILDMVKDRFSNLPAVNIDEAWNVDEPKLPKLFTPNTRSDLMNRSLPEEDTEDTTTEESENMYFTREPFVLDEIDIYNSGIELSLEPEEDSLIMSISDKQLTPLYDIHYTLKEDSDGDLKYVSWKHSDNPSGDGLENILEKGDKIEFIYAKKKMNVEVTSSQ